MTININYTKLYYLELINIISGITAIKLFACSTNVPSPALEHQAARDGTGCLYLQMILMKMIAVVGGQVGEEELQESGNYNELAIKVLSFMVIL